MFFMMFNLETKIIFSVLNKSRTFPYAELIYRLPIFDQYYITKLYNINEKMICAPFFLQITRRKKFNIVIK